MWDAATCLVYDKRLSQYNGTVDIEHELKRLGNKVDRFLCGTGKIYPKENYDYIDTFPEEATRPQAFNYARCFKQIIQKAKDQKVRRLLFLEDDATLTPEFGQYFEYVRDEAQRLEECHSVDAIFLGGIHRNGMCFSMPGYKYLFRPQYSLDLHAIIIYDSIYDNILNYPECYGRTFDGAFTELQPHKNIFGVNPNLIIQRPGYSYNSFQWEDKVWQYKEQKVI